VQVERVTVGAGMIMASPRHCNRAVRQVSQLNEPYCSPISGSADCFGWSERLSRLGGSVFKAAMTYISLG